MPMFYFFFAAFTGFFDFAEKKDFVERSARTKCRIKVLLDAGMERTLLIWLYSVSKLK